MKSLKYGKLVLKVRLSFSEITNLIRETIHAYDPTAKIILYGSRARGDMLETKVYYYEHKS